MSYYPCHNIQILFFVDSVYSSVSIPKGLKPCLHFAILPYLPYCSKMLQNLFEIYTLGTGNPNTLSAIKIKCTVIYLCPCVSVESFRMDLNELSKGSFV